MFLSFKISKATFPQHICLVIGIWLINEASHMKRGMEYSTDSVGITS